jgi:hypothetical protein
VVERQVGEQEATLAAWKGAVDAAASKLDDERAAELDSCRPDGLQPSSKVVQ